MLAIAGELKQFESIYLDRDKDRNRVRARIFTVEEELPFAGHPVLGAAAVLHDETPGAGDRADWTFALSGREVSVTTRRTGQAISASMDQGIAAFGPPLDPTEAAPFLAALGLDARTAHPRLPLQMVSTGLPYLIVPLAGDLGVARIQAPGFGALLATAGAKFVYVLDPVRREGRTWDNQGLVEDVATGSAAGPAGAYLVRHGLAGEGDGIRISQGARAGRPSELRVTARQEGNGLRVTVAGEVVLIGAGLLSILPPP
jgi:PhzF family phenazine biosynthesis protein